MDSMDASDILDVGVDVPRVNPWDIEGMPAKSAAAADAPRVEETSHGVATDAV